MPAPDFTQALGTEARDLVALAAGGELDPVYLREKEVESFIATIDRGQSVLVVGSIGVGKSAVLRGVAQELHRRGKGRLVEISTLAAVAGTHSLVDWQSKLLALANACVKASAVLVFSDVANLTSSRTAEIPRASMLDVLRPLIESRELIVAGEITPESLEHMESGPRTADLFQKLEVAPLDAGAVEAAIERSATAAGLAIDKSGRQTLLELTARFLPTRPQPGPALALLRQVSHYLHEKEGIGERVPIDRAFIERVFSIYSGLPLFIVSRDVTKPVEELRAWFRERIVGQHEAIEAVVEAISRFKAGLHNPSRPIGTFLFVGPTGVGKTELAQALATFLFGGPQRLLRFDAADLKDQNSAKNLLGDSKHAGRPAALLDPIRAQPFQLVVFDEIEKAHESVLDLLRPLLEEGRLSPSHGQAVDFRSTVVICTSNANARDPQIRAVGFGDEKEITAKRVRLALEEHFEPELLNAFQHIAVFHPLSRAQVHEVARKELARLLRRDGIASRQLQVEVDEKALDLVVERGFDPRYGARALKREIQAMLVMPIAMALMEKPVEPGQTVRVTAGNGRVEVRLGDAAERRRDDEPIRTIGRRLAREDVLKSIAELRARLDGVSLGVGEPALRDELDRLAQRRTDHVFWRGSGETTRSLQELEFAQATVALLEHLKADIDALADECTAAEPSAPLAPFARRALELEAKVALAKLELVYMGRAERYDALLEIRPVGESGQSARDKLVKVYGDWAEERGFQVEILREPLEADEPVLLSIVGEYAYGFLHYEPGLHRVVVSKASSVARVRVAPWTGRRGPVGFREESALKRTGAYGGKVRSRVECDGGLVLQNTRSLADNRELAIEVVGSWLQAPAAPDDIVRRYEPETPLVRDVLTDTNSGHPEALFPERFHELLCQRVRRMWEMREPPTPAA